MPWFDVPGRRTPSGPSPSDTEHAAPAPAGPGAGTGHRLRGRLPEAAVLRPLPGEAAHALEVVQVLCARKLQKPG